jgi:clan AA aspartic protease (TIGR02281 family)
MDDARYIAMRDKHSIPYAGTRRVLLLFPLALLAAAAQAADFDTALPMRDAGTSTFYVDAVINGHAVQEFMVDTGSAHVVIDGETLSQLKEQGDAEYVKELAGVLADGSTTSVPVYRVAAISLGHCLIRDVEVAVFPRAKRNILGLSALRKVAPFAISVEPPTLKLSNCRPDPSSAVAASRSQDDAAVEITGKQIVQHPTSHSAFFSSGIAP